eukprot:gene4337-20546_t
MGVESPPINNSYKITTEKKLQQNKQLARIFFSLFLVCLVLLICAVVFKFGCPSKVATSREKSQSPVIKFLHVSDIHLDLQYNNSLSKKSLCRNLVNITSETAPFQALYGRVRCDSPEILVESALGFMRNLSLTKLGKIDFFMFTGDQVAHAIGRDYGNSTIMERVLNNMRAASNKIALAFSGIPIFPSFGNNDLPGDYVLPKDSKFYEDVLAFWQPLVLCKNCSFKVTTEEELKKTFLAGGYYKAAIPPLKLVLLQLNSNYWNVECIKRNPKGQTLVIADAQMKWLENQLQIAKSADNKVIISGHIPPGINAYGAFDGFWAQNYTQKYVDLVTKTYSDTVIGQLFGHIHKDDLRLQMLNDKAGSVDTHSSFVFTAPGITPIYNNNPGFRVVTFNTVKRLLTDYHQYYMDLVLTTPYCVIARQNQFLSKRGKIIMRAIKKSVRNGFKL